MPITKGNRGRTAQGRNKGRQATAVSGPPGAARAAAHLAPTATGLLIPRIHKDVPVEFVGGKEEAVLSELLNQGLLKDSDEATDTEAFIDTALHRIPGFAAFEDMGSCRIDDEQYQGRPAGKDPIYFGVDLWSMDQYGSRIQLAEVIGDTENIELIKWMIAVLNSHPLLAAPDRWKDLVEGMSGNIEGLEGTPAGDSGMRYDAKLYESDWLKDSDLCNAHNNKRMLPLIKDAELRQIFADLLDCPPIPAMVDAQSAFACVSFKSNCLVDHCWDADRENDNGESAFSFGGDITQFIECFDVIYKATQPVTKLISWKSKSTCLDSLSDLQSLFTREDPRQLRFALGIESPKA